MIRVVLDTNILVSGLLFPGGPPARLIDIAKSGGIRNTSSQYIVDELDRVLTQKFQLDRPRIIRLLERIETISDMVDPPPLSPHPQIDGDDLPILACAIAARAKFIVTGDRKMLAAGRHERVRLISAADALKLMA